MSDFRSAGYGEGGLASSRRAQNGLFYLLIGGGIGATVALLFTPKSGLALRAEMSDITKRKIDETRHLAEGLKERTSEFYETAKVKTGRVYEFAAKKMSRSPNQEFALGRDDSNGDILELDSGGSFDGTTDRSSNTVVSAGVG